MKNIFFIIGIITVFTYSTSSGQSINDEVFYFCKLTDIKIAFSDLEKCPTLSPTNKKIELKSFTISVLINSKDHPEGFYRDIFIIGNTIPKATISLFKQLLVDDPYVKVVVENIVAIDSGKTNKYRGFTFWLK